MTELFVFLKMGGAHSAHSRANRLTVIPIAEDRHELCSVYDGLANFDLRTARCYLAEDSERLRACIARGFGEDADCFNTAVRELIRRNLHEPERADAEPTRLRLQRTFTSTELANVSATGGGRE
jgi:hypothetical protein